MFTYYIAYKCEYSEEYAFARVISTESTVDVIIDHIAVRPDDRFGIYAPVVFDNEHKIVPFIEEIKYPEDGEVERIRVCVNPKWTIFYVTTSDFCMPKFTPVKL